MSLFQKKNLYFIGVAVTMAVGLALRFFRIATNDFVFFDEGFYLNYHRAFYDLLTRHFSQNLEDWRHAVSAWFRLSLGSGKALWFMLADARFFVGLYRAWYVPRILAALSGALTLPLAAWMARRYFNSKAVGLLTLILLALLPSHVFYSRIGLQETTSTLFFLAGFYFYLFPRRFGPRTFLSATLLSAAYFTNYRLIFLPLHVVVTEFFLSFTEKRSFDVRKVVWHTVVFLAFLVVIGALDQAQNTIVTFSWMFHQSHLAADRFVWMNLLSYPYYLFRLENILFGLFFFATFACFFIRNYPRQHLFPFVLVCFHMGIFTFAAQKGARYIGVILPFAAMAVAAVIAEAHKRFDRAFGRVVLWSLVAVMCSFLLAKSVRLSVARSDYRPAMETLLRQDPEVKVVASQNYILNLYTSRPDQAVAVPRRFFQLAALYGAGYRYLILGPQAYVSLTDNEKPFSVELDSYLNVIDKNVAPLRVYDHFNSLVMERFVFEHSEDLGRSIAFLRRDPAGLGRLRVYDLRACLREIMIRLNRQRGQPLTGKKEAADG